MTTLRVDWKQPDRLGPVGWADLLSRCPRANPFQSWSWGEAGRDIHGQVPHRAVIFAGERPIGLMQLTERRYLGLFTFAQLIRGPLFVGGAETAAALPQVLRHLRRTYRPTRGAVLALTPELDAGPVADKFLDDARFRRVKTGYSSAWRDLEASERRLRRDLRGNFRNQLKRAEAAGLTIEDGDPGDRGWLLEEHRKHRARRRYGGPAPELIRALPMAETPVLLARTAEGETAAAVLFITHGRTATYQVGWTGEAGRAVNAHNLLLWRGMLHLKRAGFRRLDLGGLDDSDAPGAAHFKAGLGGEPFTLAGTYV